MKFLPSKFAAFAAGTALCAALGAQARAANVTWVGLDAFPQWDFFYAFNWSPMAAPTGSDTAIFPSSLVPRSGQIFLTNFAGGNPTPIAANLIFNNNWTIIGGSGPAPNSGDPLVSSLTLTHGNVTVMPGFTATIDANIVATSGLLTKLGQGTLLLEQTVNGSVVVQQGVLGGNFTVNGNLTNLATLSPGNSPGTIHVNGNFQQIKGASLNIQIASPNSFDQLSITGNAKLGGTVSASLLNGFLPGQGEKFTILTAGGVLGQFDAVNAPVWDDLTLRAIYGKHTVTLQTVIDSFQALGGLTSNQNAVARKLDAVIYDSRETKLINYLYGQGFNQLPGDFDKISPEELTSIFAIGTALATEQSLNIQRRTDDIRSGSNGFSAAGLAINGMGPSYSGGFGITTGVAGPSGSDGKESKEVKNVVPAENRWGAFLSGTGEWVNVSGTDNARGYELASGGFTLGVDYKVCPNFAIGVMAGYTGTTADLTDHGRVWVNGGNIGLYATFFQNTAPAPAPTMSKDSKEVAPPAPSQPGGFYADVAATGGYSSYDTRRGALEGTARGDTDGGNINALFGMGYDFKSGGLTFGPTASFNYTYTGTNGFTETGSLAPLNIHGGQSESLRSAFGLKASYDCKLGSVLFKPELRATWQHEYGNTVYSLDSDLANGGGGNFTVGGPKLGRDSALVGAGFAVQFSERCSTYLYYDGELGRTNYISNAVTGGVRVSF